MKNITFINGVFVAAALSLSAGALLALLTVIIAPPMALIMVLSIVSLVYLLYLLQASKAKSGRFTSVLAWCLLVVGTWVLSLSLLMTIAVHVGFIWLVRSLYFYKSTLSAITDLGLNILALGAALWACTQTQSAIAGFWVFFLIQALFVNIPDQWPHHSTFSPRDVHHEAFAQALRSADRAINRIHTQHLP